MNQDVFALARQLQKKLDQVNPEADRDTFVWIHGFLIGLINRVESAIPALGIESPLAFSPADRAEDRRLASQLALESLPDEPDSLDEIERELAGEDPDGTPGVPV